MVIKFSEVFRICLNALSQLSIRFSGSLATFLVTILITSQLGLVSLGSFVKVTSFVTMFYLLIDFGINIIYLRDNFKKAEELFGNLIALRFILSSLIFALVLFITLALPSSSNSGFSFNEKLGILLFSFTLFSEGILVSFSGLVQKKLLQHVLVIPSIVSAIIVILVVYLGIIQNNLLIIFISYPIAELVQIVLTFLLVKKSVLFQIVPTAFKTFSKSTVLAAAPLALMLFLNVVYFRLDSLILALYKSNADVGSYGFAYKVFEFLIAFPTFLGVSIFPILILHKDNKKMFMQKIKSYSSLLLSASLILFVLVFFLSPYIVILGSTFSSAIIPLQILSFALPFFFLTSLFQWILLLREKVKILISIYAITMIINIVLNIIYIPLYSYIAAAVITVITEGLVFILMIGAFSLSTVKNSSNPNDK